MFDNLTSNLLLKALRSWKPRHWIALACAALIVIRAVMPTLRIDELSVGLFVLGSVVVLIPDIGDLLSRVRRVKKGDFELEFEGRLEELRRRTEETESELEAAHIDFGPVPEVVQTRVVASLVEPRAALIALAVEIETRLRALAEIHGIRNRGGFFSPRRTVEELVERDQLDEHIPGLFADFWAIRNQAIHGLEFAANRENLFSLVDLGMRILRILYATREPETDAPDG